ncbi:hypothetical protein [Roseibium sp. TrichSKD4]|nr:hypothetical protein [Roseibium sp. TrichSKD4]
MKLQILCLKGFGFKGQVTGARSYDAAGERGVLADRYIQLVIGENAGGIV